MEEMLPVIGRKRLMLSVPFSVARMQAGLLGLLPNAPLTSDQVTLLRYDNVVSAEAGKEGRTLPGLGITPETVAAILPSYLWRYRPAGQFSRTFAV
jgi:NADH dehydrogenase